MWTYCAESLGMGMGIGLIASSLFTKAIFAPFIIYSVSCNRDWLTSMFPLANGRTEDEAVAAGSGGDDGQHETLLAARRKYPFQAHAEVVMIALL
jgi:hypothetical protein